ncbi:MAG: hypothetical protein P1Q69_07470 [Candidatus Thorarchaeota archaeon]|nr:hypothetical protein [Candidatus Thorarchaeota archaeon]
MIQEIVFLFAYLMAGLSLKFGDDLLDEIDSPSLAWFPLGASGILFGLLMALSEWDLVLLTAIVIGVLLSGKVNRQQYIIGFIAIGAILLFFGLPAITDILSWFALLFMLFMASVLDEKGNDWTDSNANPNAALLFEYRFVLKISALLLAIPWPGFLATAVGLWLFDTGYEIAGWLTQRLR